MLGLADRSATTGRLRLRAPVPHTPLLPSTGLSPVRLRRVNLRRGLRVGGGAKPPSSSQRSICLAGMSRKFMVHEHRFQILGEFQTVGPFARYSQP